MDESDLWGDWDPPESWYNDQVVDVYTNGDIQEGDYSDLNEKLGEQGLRLGILGGVKGASGNVVRVDGSASDKATPVALSHFGGVTPEQHQADNPCDNHNEGFFSGLLRGLFG